MSGENGTLAFVLMIAEGESELTSVKRSKKNFLMESHVKETQASKKSATCTIVLVIKLKHITIEFLVLLHKKF